MVRRGIKPIERLRGLGAVRDPTRLLKDISTPQLSDAVKSVTGENRAITSLKSVNGLMVAGRAVTAETSSRDWGTSVLAVDAADSGDVIFIRTDGDEMAVWGELTSMAAMNRGIAGAVIYGSCRDLDAIRGLDFPVFSRSHVPCAGEPLAEGSINMAVECDGVTVEPGDFIMGDESGVVAVPWRLIGDVVKEALKIKEKEILIKDAYGRGLTLSEILGLK